MMRLSHEIICQILGKEGSGRRRKAKMKKQRVKEVGRSGGDLRCISNIQILRVITNWDML